MVVCLSSYGCITLFLQRSALALALGRILAIASSFNGDSSLCQALQFSILVIFSLTSCTTIRREFGGWNLLSRMDPRMKAMSVSTTGRTRKGPLRW